MTRTAPPFATTGKAPAQLSDPTGARNDRTGLRVPDQSLLELGVLVARQILLKQPREELGLDKAEHWRIIRQRRSTSMPEAVRETANVSGNRRARGGRSPAEARPC